MVLTYAYFIKNMNTNEFYFGSRCANVKKNKSANDDLWKHYFTSSKPIHALRKEFGDESFEFKILLESENYDDCYWFEQELIKQYIGDLLCLNKQYVDRELGQQKFSIDGPCSDERRAAISKTKKGELNPFFGKTHTQEVKDNLSALFTGRVSPNKGKTRIMPKEEKLKRSGAGNGMFGGTHTPEAREAIRQSALKRQSLIREKKRAEALSEIN